MALNSVYEIMPSVTRRVMASHLMWEFKRILRKLCDGLDVDYRGLSETSISHQIYVEVKCRSDLYSFDAESCSWQNLLELIVTPTSIRPIEFMARCYRLMPENCENAFLFASAKLDFRGLEVLSLVKDSVKARASMADPRAGSSVSGKPALPVMAVVAKEIEAAGLPYVFERKIEIQDENE